MADTVSASTALGWAMEIEANGEVFYRAAAKQSADKDVKLLFEDLAYQEQRHFRTFQRMLEKAPTAEGRPVDAEEYRTFLGVALSNALFAGPEKGLRLATDAQNETEALQAAIAFEKDTLLFFYDLHDLVAPSQREAISAIIAEERDHVRQLARVLRDGPFVS